MGEGIPVSRPSYEDLLKVWNEDRADSVRGPIIKMVASVTHEATMRNDLNDPVLLGWEELQNAFPEQFGDGTWTAEQKKAEAKRYRLYHFAIGSTPEGDLFDTVGEKSLEAGFRKLAEEHNIKISEV